MNSQAVTVDLTACQSFLFYQFLVNYTVLSSLLIKPIKHFSNSFSCLLMSHLLPQVHTVSRFIMNGVCIRFRGAIDLKRLEGNGCLEFDEENAKVEDAYLKQQYKCAAVY